MGCKNGGNINSALLTKREGNACKPFVKMRDDSFILLVGDEL
jgi:hypothetical protein